MPLRTQGNVLDWIIGETVFPEIVPLVRMPPVAYHRLYPGLYQLVTHRRAVVSRVQPHVLGLLSQPLFNILSYLCYGFYVVDIGRSDPHIHHNVVLAVHGPVLAVMKAVRLAFLVQLAAFRVAFADLSCRGRIIVILLVKGLLAQLLAVTVYGLVQLFQMRFGRPLHHDRRLFVLVSLGLDVRRVRIQNRPTHQSLFHGLAQNLVEDPFGNVVIPETPFPIHAQGCGIRRFLRQAQPTEPFIRHVIIDLFLQPPLRSDAVEIPHKQHTEQHLRLNRRTPQVSAVQRRAQPADE